MSREFIEKVETIVIAVALMAGVLLIAFHWR
jgi:hypothetical protein